jgi:hypothetical protein
MGSICGVISAAENILSKLDPDVCIEQMLLN